MPETEGLAEIDAVVADTRAYPASESGKPIAACRHGALDVVLSATILDELRRRVLPKLALQVDLVEREAGDDPAQTDAQDQPVLDTLIAAFQNKNHVGSVLVSARELVCCVEVSKRLERST
ncbi:MAG: hypothetical protein WCP63_01440 [Cyanobium sp. ELA712]